jgi:hypothetical protein
MARIGGTNGDVLQGVGLMFKTCLSLPVFEQFAGGGEMEYCDGASKRDNSEGSILTSV